MAYGNTITVVGNLARDPELKFTGSGTAVVSGTVAVYAGKDTQGNEKPAHFVDFTVWDNNGAQNVADSFRKGDRVIVIGSIKQDRWEKDGQKRSKLSITAEEVGGSARWANVSISRTPKDGDFDAPDEAPF